MTSDSGAEANLPYFHLSIAINRLPLFDTDYSMPQEYMSFEDVRINFVGTQQIRVIRIGSHEGFSRAGKPFAGPFFVRTVFFSRKKRKIFLDSIDPGAALFCGRKK